MKEMPLSPMARLGLFGGVGLGPLPDSMTHVLRDKSQGTAHIHPITIDQAWAIAKDVFRWEGSETLEEHRDEGYMLASSGMDLVSFGALMGAWLEPVGIGQTKVTVVIKPRANTAPFMTQTEGSFHRRFAQAVQLM